MKKLFLIATLIFNIFASGTQNNQLNESIEFIKNLEKNYLSTLQSKTISVNKKYTKFLEALDNHFAVKSISGFVLGKYRRSFDKEKREKFIILFRNMLAKVYVDKFQNIGPIKQYSFHSEQVNNNRTEEYAVTTKVKTNNESFVTLKWDVIKTTKGYKIIDISVDGISMSLTQRDEFSNEISNLGNDIQLFLVNLEKKYGVL